jgi:type I restriction enzyme S subunit
MPYNPLEAKSIEQLCKVVDCEHKTAPYVDESEYHVVRTSNVRNGQLLMKDMKYTTFDGFNEWTARAVPEYGDVLFTREAPAGESCLVPKNKKLCMGQRMVMLRADKSQVDPLYLSMILNKERTRADILRLSIGTTVSRINIADIKKLKVASPPLPEQQRIARILGTWNKAISTTEHLIDNNKQQKKALMQQLLTGKKRLFDDSGNPFDGEWEDVHLEDVCHVNPKKASKPDNGLVSFIPMDAVSEDTKLLRQEIKQYDEVSKGFTSFTNRDCLVAKITPCFENGKGAFVNNLCNGVGFGSTEFHVLRAKKDMCSEFVYYITQTREFRLKGEMNMQGSAGHRRVTTDYLKLFKIVLPPSIAEQQKIASVLVNADKEIELLEQQLVDLKNEKKALMQQLLTGKRRVKINNKEVT